VLEGDFDDGRAEDFLPVRGIGGVFVEAGVPVVQEFEIEHVEGWGEGSGEVVYRGCRG